MIAVNIILTNSEIIAVIIITIYITSNEVEFKQIYYLLHKIVCIKCNELLHYRRQSSPSDLV